MQEWTEIGHICRGRARGNKIYDQIFFIYVEVELLVIRFMITFFVASTLNLNIIITWVKIKAKIEGKKDKFQKMPVQYAFNMRIKCQNIILKRVDKLEGKAIPNMQWLL